MSLVVLSGTPDELCTVTLVTVRYTLIYSNFIFIILYDVGFYCKNIEFLDLCVLL